jgi:hypothetical protein
MTLRVLMFLECNRCHAAFEQKFVASKIFHDDLRDEVHEMVLAAEANDWECRRNATEHYCAKCLEPF